jgi:hypothetical protein
MSHGLFVISDIDGTLVPHPFLSGKNVNDRRRSFERLLELFRYDNFGLMTGRRQVGFERYGSEYQLPLIYPAFLGVEFGAHLAIRGEWVSRSPQNEELAELLGRVEQAVAALPGLHHGGDPEEALRKGAIETYYIELKSRIAQVEAHYPTAEANRLFQETVEEIVNAQCIGPSCLTFQSFASQRRLDVVERGFVPKSGFLPTLARHLLPRGGVNSTTLVTLGDELYDSYMFRYLKEEARTADLRVCAISVARPLPYADVVVRDTESALGLVEELLAGETVQRVVARYAQPARPG